MNISSIGLSALILFGAARTALPQAVFIHPGILHTREDLDRMKTMVAAGVQPYLDGWNWLKRDGHSSAGYTPSPRATVTRTSGGAGSGHAEMRGDAQAAYLNALAWQVTGDAAHARKAVAILDAWSSNLNVITGDADRYLAAGLAGYHFANAGEILRSTYPEWNAAGIQRLRTMLLTKFYPMCHDFLVRHDGQRLDFYFAAWDAIVLETVASIGVFCDDRAKYQEAVDYFKQGGGNGSILRAVWDGETGQLQEAGRDWAHAQLGIASLATLCEIAWNQGDDLYGYADNRLLKGFEYTAKYLLGNPVPFKIYRDSNRTFTTIAPRITQMRPTYEMVWNHYTNRRNLPAPFTRQMAEGIRPEGFSGDHPGFGTFLFTRPFSPVGLIPGRPEEGGRSLSPRWLHAYFGASSGWSAAPEAGQDLLGRGVRRGPSAAGDVRATHAFRPGQGIYLIRATGPEGR